MEWWLGDGSFPARWSCGSGWAEDPWLGWLHVISSVVIFVSFSTIAIAMWVWLRRSHITHGAAVWTLLLFVSFIAICGAGHGLYGAEFWVPIYRLSGPWYGLLAVVSASTAVYVVRNLKGLLEAHEKMESRSELFEHAWEDGAIAMCFVSATGRILRVNHAAEQFFDRSEDYLRQLSFQDITHPEDLNADEEDYARCKAGIISRYTLDKRYVLPDGVERWGRLTVSVVRDRNRKVKHALSQIVDIDAEKRQEERLSKAVEELRASQAEAINEATKLGLSQLIERLENQP